MKTEPVPRHATYLSIGIETLAYIFAAPGVLTVTGLKVRKEVLMALTTDMLCVIQKAETNQF